MRHTVLGIVFLLLPAAALQAQRIQFDIPPAVVAKAVESVDVTLDGPLLRFSAKFFAASGDDRALSDMVQKLEGIYVKSYKFDEDGAYDRSLVDRVRGQLGPSWRRIVQVKSRGGYTEVYADMIAQKVAGVVVLSAEPRELTIANLVGAIDLDKLSDLEGHFGIPKASKEEHDHE